MAKVIRKDAVVAGKTEASQRQFIASALTFLLPSHPVVHIPAVGQFELARAAIVAGYRPECIKTYDISLFSDLVGSLVDPTFPEPTYQLSVDNAGRYAQLIQSNGDSPAYRAAFVMWCMKRAELKRAPHFKAQLEDLEDNMVEHVEKLYTKLLALIDGLEGIQYRHATMEEVVARMTQPDHVFIGTKPLFNGKPVKGFQYDDEILYDPQAVQGQWKPEFERFWEFSLRSPSLMFWHTDNLAVGTDHLVFAKEFKPTKLEYWVANHPEVLENFQNMGAVATYNRQKYEPLPLPVWGLYDELTPESKIRFQVVPAGTELYYRDLWAHRLGATGGDRYMVMIVDEKVFAAVILQLGQFTHMQSQWIFEQSGFSAPSKRYQRMVRLLMWCVTCRQFGDDVLRTSYHVNRHFDPIGTETTCLSKYRKMKGNIGILTDRVRDKLPNGLYHIIQNAVFREEGYDACIRRFLDEQPKPEGEASGEN